MPGPAGIHADADPVTRLVILVPGLHVLITRHLKDFADALLVPVRFDQAPAADRVARSQILGMGAAEEARAGRLGPYPGGEEHRADQALGVSWRDVDDKVLDLEGIKRLQVFTQDPDVPVIDEGRRLL